MKLTGWIIYNGFLLGNKFRDFAEMIYDAAISHGHEVIIKRNDEMISMVNDHINLLPNTRLPDYVVFTDKDIYLAKQLELLGVRVFNSASAIEISDDKIKTYHCLSEKQIPIPKTIIAPKTFGMDNLINDNYLRIIIEQLSFPFIIKEAFGSFGEQVYLIKNELELRNRLRRIKGNSFMFQQFVETSYGVDLRLQVVGDEVITAMKRTSQHDFRANVTSGGTMSPYEPNDLEKNIAKQATKAVGADFAGVDLLFGKNQARYVCEVNSNAHIRNLYECTGVNVATNIIYHIEQKLKEWKK